MKRVFLNSVAAVSLIAFIVSVGVLLYVGAKPQGQSVILAPTPEPAKPKRYVIWNKRHFVRQAGDAQMMQTAHDVFAQSLGARNIKQLELINAVTFEADEAKMQSFSAFSKTQPPDDWEVQEEYTHGILMGATPVATKCYQSAGPILEIACPGAGNPGPTPNPSPTPNPEPGPAPNPNPNPGPTCMAKSWGVTRVRACEAQALVGDKLKNVKVCDVDTGADLSHPNRGNILATQDFTGKGSAADGNGHGSHTLGTIGAVGNGVGIAGGVGLLVCKGLSDSGSGTSSALAQCLTWCGQQGAQIVSNSWGSPQSDPMINQAIASLTARGIYVFVAAGNDSGPVNWPAKLSGSNANVFAIAASDNADRITSFSSRGPEVRFISPGAGIISNWPGGGTRSLDGTSMATPHAAAICAFGVAKGKRPCITPSGAVAGYQFADALTTAQ